MDVKYFELALVKTDPDLILKIYAKRNFSDTDKVKAIMRNNCWTVKQFVDLTGKGMSTITTMTIQGKMLNGKFVTPLDTCYPFPDVKGNGPKFIIRNEKSMRVLENYL